MRRIGVLTSGGDAPGMNAAIRSVVRSGIHRGLEVIGVRRGYDGLVKDDFYPLVRHDVSNIIQQGGTILFSARSADFMTVAGRKQAYLHLQDHQIDALIVIGGDGTFAGAEVFNQEFDYPILGLPGTIDNDLFGTDFTIGYDTAINTAMEAIDRIKDTANAHNRLFFVEVMGRDAGFIALRAGIATGAEAVLIPESKTNLDHLIQKLEETHQSKKTSSIVIVAEGDDAGGAFKIADEVKKRFDDYDIRVTILGHIQRGGRPTCMERVRASRMGNEVVNALLDGRRGEMVGLVKNQVNFTPFSRAIKHHQELNTTLLKLVEILG